MNTKENSIDIYEYRTDLTTIERLRYIAAVCEAHESGQPVEMISINDWAPDEEHWSPMPKPSTEEIIKGFRPHWLAYRIARPKIAEGHNPDKLTEAQVGVQDGWRLLTVEENTSLIHAFGKTDGIEYWSRMGGQWDSCAAGGCAFTYRTKNPPGHYLPKPEPVKKLVPWTFETAPKGCVLVRRMSGHAQLVLGWGGGTIALHTASSGIREMDYEDLMSDYEHSTDSGKTWLPCGTDA